MTDGECFARPPLVRGEIQAKSRKKRRIEHGGRRTLFVRNKYLVGTCSRGSGQLPGPLVVQKQEPWLWPHFCKYIIKPFVSFRLYISLSITATMDKFVTVIKPSTRTLVGEDSGVKQGKQKRRPAYRYNPYSDSKANERQPGDIKEKRRIEKYAAWVIEFH